MVQWQAWFTQSWVRILLAATYFFCRVCCFEVGAQFAAKDATFLMINTRCIFNFSKIVFDRFHRIVFVCLHKYINIWCQGNHNSYHKEKHIITLRSSALEENWPITWAPWMHIVARLLVWDLNDAPKQFLFLNLEPKFLPNFVINDFTFWQLIAPKVGSLGSTWLYWQPRPTVSDQSQPRDSPWMKWNLLWRVKLAPTCWKKETGGPALRKIEIDWWWRTCFCRNGRRINLSILKEY